MTLHYLSQCYFSFSFFFSPSYICSFSLRLFSPSFSFKPLKLEKGAALLHQPLLQTPTHPAPLSSCASSILAIHWSPNTYLFSYQKKLLPASPYNNLYEFFQSQDRTLNQTPTKVKSVQVTSDLHHTTQVLKMRLDSVCKLGVSLEDS